MSIKQKYDVFLSFASEDESIARSIWDMLSHSGLQVFWSDESLKENIGESFFTVIQNALLESTHFLLVCTKGAMSSHWVREEYESFCSNCYIPSGRKRKILIYKTESCEQQEIPFLLKNIQTTNSIEAIIKILGGDDFDALKKANVHLLSIIEDMKKDSLLKQAKISELEGTINEIKNKSYEPNINQKASNKGDKQTIIDAESYLSDNIARKIRIIASDILDIKDINLIGENSKPEDFGADSLDLVELTMAMEEEFELEIPDKDLEKLNTFIGAIKYIREMEKYNHPALSRNIT